MFTLGQRAIFRLSAASSWHRHRDSTRPLCQEIKSPAMQGSRSFWFCSHIGRLSTMPVFHAFGWWPRCGNFFVTQRVQMFLSEEPSSLLRQTFTHCWNVHLSIDLRKCYGQNPSLMYLYVPILSKRFLSKTKLYLQDIKWSFFIWWSNINFLK